MAQYLVTGIAGFIGSNIARKLVAQGGQVRGIDNLATGNRNNLTDILSKIDFREADILDTTAIADACRGVDFIFHEAAIPSVPKSVKDPVSCNRACVDGTVSVLVAARDAKVKRVVYAASSSAYGDTPTLPKRESMASNPISPYAVSKLSGELYAQSFHKVMGLETVCLRYFNVFGARQHPTSQYAAVIPIFIGRMMAGEQPTIFGDGTQSRDFTYIENVISANVLACQAASDKVGGRVFNIAAGKNFSLNTVYSMLQELTGFDRPALFAPPRGGDVRDSLADTTQAMEAMGYKTLVDFKEGLRRTVEWYKTN